MKRLLPDSLMGRMLLVLAAGLIASHAVGWWIYSSDREAAVREVGGLAVAQRIANVARLVDEAPADWQPRIVAASSDQTFRVALTKEKPSLDDEEPGPLVTAIKAYLVETLALGAAREPLVAGEAIAQRPGRGRGLGWGRMMGRGSDDAFPAGGHGRGRGGGGGRWGMMGGPEALVALQVAIPLTSGQWITVATALPDADPLYSRQFIVSMLVMAAVIVAVSIWAARRVTAPLAALDAAAQRLGRDVDAPPIVEAGTRETRQASRAFNDMQTRLREMIGHRTRLLAAISHDLRTPLTSLRLRAETHPDAEERDKMLATIDEMTAMVATTLQYARDEMVAEPARTTDLAALVDSVVDDLADIGKDVKAAPAKPILVACRPTALKRALRNLIDNAVQYGERARVSLHDAGANIDVVVDDDGPGLPPEELTRVFQPFYRREESRSRDTGGVGLGLAIARSLVERHNGSIALENRPEGGLRARLRLPKTA